MYTQYSDQRETYKVLENLISKDHVNARSFLKHLIESVVSHEDFDVIGGRIWKLDPDQKCYTLYHQYGNVKEIPAGFTVKIKDFPFLAELLEKRTSLQYETNQVLKSKGIQLYSVTGVGELIPVDGEYYYKYLLGFNAPEIKQTFFETLNIINSMATITLRNLYTQEVHKKLEKDKLQASEIQQNLLPDNQLRFHDFDIYGICQPADFVGGDYFDFIRSTDDEEDSLGVLIYDAASHGLPAAIQALFVSGAIKMGMNFSTKISKFMSRLNTLIFDTFPYERFVTMFYCQLSLSSNRLVLYSNAGHCPPIHYRPTTGSFQQLKPTGGLLGLMEQQKFGVENIRMHPGDILMLNTDGIIDAKNKTRDMYGEARIMKMLEKHHKESAESIAKAIIADVEKFSNAPEYNDDKTIVIIKRDPIA